MKRLFFGIFLLSTSVLAFGQQQQLDLDRLPQRELHWEHIFTIPRLLWFTGPVEYKIEFPVDISSFRPPTCYYFNAETGKSEGVQIVKADLGSVTVKAPRGFRVLVKCTGYQLKQVPLRDGNFRLLPAPKM